MELRARKFLILALALAGAVGGLHAQSYTVDWYKIAGGGGTSTGGTYQVNGTIGQPDAGATVHGGKYAVKGGFWSTLADVQMPFAPAAAPLTVVKYAGTTWKIKIADLATNWTCASGDKVGLVSVNVTSTNATSVTWDTVNIYYQGTNAGWDRFDYTVANALNPANYLDAVFTATGSVFVVSTNFPVTGKNMSWQPASGGKSVALQFGGIPSFNYVVQVATNLEPADWQSVSTNTAATNGLWTFTDSLPTNSSPRFYRVVTY